MKRLISLRLVSATAVSIVAGCAFNYPQTPDADLYIPLISGFTESLDVGTSYIAQNSGAFRISRALEQGYIGNWLQDVDLKRCDGRILKTGEKELLGVDKKDILVQITKVLEPFSWEAIEDNRSLYGNGYGGVLFGNGVKVEDATLLSLRFALTPWEPESELYLWKSKRSSLERDLPYQYIKLEDISLHDDAIALLNDKTKIYDNDSGLDSGRELEDEESIVLDIEQIEEMLAHSSNSEWPRFLPIKATRKLSIEFSDGPNNAPIRYELPKDQTGYIKLVNLSYFPGESKAYMGIVRSLVLAQAGACDSAFSVYQHIAEQLDNKTRVQMALIIAHLSGRRGRDISAVLDELDRLVTSEVEKQYIEDYRRLSQENL